jgi:hypothetical protein
VAIPGLKAKFEVRGKVRIGERRTSASNKQYPAATDYFVSADDEFLARERMSSGAKVSSLRIVLPHDDVDDCFSTGLEWWVKGKEASRSTLACYTKGDGTALRKAQMVNEGDVVLDVMSVGADRKQIVCPFRECPIFKRGDCKPMGRLIFFLEAGRTDQVLELDTKSWNSIERLTAALQGARLRGPLTGRVFELSVAFESRGANRFPLLSLQEVDVQINNAADVETAEALLAVERAEAEGADARVALAAGLDVQMPDWRDRGDVIARIKEIGPAAALESFKARWSR